MIHIYGKTTFWPNCTMSRWTLVVIKFWWLPFSFKKWTVWLLYPTTFFTFWNVLFVFCFRANIDLYQMRLAVFVGSSGLGGRTPGRQTQASTLCKTHRNTKNTQMQQYKNIKNIEINNYKIRDFGDTRLPDTRL